MSSTGLKLLASYSPVVFLQSADRDQLEAAIRQAVANLKSTEVFCNEQSKYHEGEIQETLGQARKECLEAIAIAERALNAVSPDDSGPAVKNFLSQYDKVKASVRHFFFLSDRRLWPIVDEVL